MSDTLSTRPTSPREAPMSLLDRLIKDESGESHLEYALIAAFMGTALTGALIGLKDGLDTFYISLAGILSTIL